MLRRLHIFAFICTIMKFSNSEDNTKRYFGMRSLFMECRTNSWNNTGDEIFETFRNCIQNRLLTILDSVLVDDVIPIFDGINLVKYQVNSLKSTDEKSDRNLTHELPKNITTWSTLALHKLIRLLRSHVIKIDIDYLTNSIGSDVNEPPQGEKTNVNHARRRRHKRRHHMMPLMMMGLLLMGSVLIPMGFQFLAVLGGKALLLAKMALILSSIQGLKKIATNGVNYGLYHAPVAETWHERSGQEIRMGQLEPRVYDIYSPKPLS